MFQLDLAPADPILGLTETFNADTHPDKINLGVGVYQDATGKTPILKAVTQAETHLLKTESSKGYLSIPGVPELATHTQELLFGAGHAIIQESRAKTAQTPGGTGALRVAADFLLRAAPKATVWLSNPSWANHQAIFGAAGFPIKDYRYYAKASQGLDGEGFMADLEGVAEGDIVILHGCCHNPSGIDSIRQRGRRSQRKQKPRMSFALSTLRIKASARDWRKIALAFMYCSMRACPYWSQAPTQRISVFTVSESAQSPLSKKQPMTRSMRSATCRQPSERFTRARLLTVEKSWRRF